MKRSIFIALASSLILSTTLPAPVAAGNPVVEVGMRGPQARSQPHYGGSHLGRRHPGGWGGGGGYPPPYYYDPPQADMPYGWYFGWRSARRYRVPAQPRGYHHCPDYGWHDDPHGWR